MKFQTKEELIQSRGANLSKEQIIAIGMRNKEIIHLKASGLHYKEIASRFNLSKQYVKTICHKHGVWGR